MRKPGCWFRGRKTGRTYYVWYKVDSATNYNGVEPACIVVKIKKNETSTTTPTETTEKVESVTVYRLYYGPTMEHFYTTSAYERRVLIDKYGWVDEGIAWKSPKAPATDEEKKTIKPVYRLFNPFTTDHHYTKDANERKTPAFSLFVPAVTLQI